MVSNSLLQGFEGAAGYNGSDGDPGTKGEKGDIGKIGPPGIKVQYDRTILVNVPLLVSHCWHRVTQAQKV